jgi:hypothetical protein
MNAKQRRKARRKGRWGTSPVEVYCDLWLLARAFEPIREKWARIADVNAELDRGDE